ncbi:MAG: response regulator [Deltaproteobacteria bacterium]|jgi:putative two-component system response regulator|nr:response regulator [Deltaproteobacteria bacterium]
MREILVVDDNESSLQQIRSLLQGTYNFSLVTSGKQALSICAMEHPDLVLLDIEMPEMDGFAVIDVLRQTPELSRIPVIFLTANQDVATEARGLKAGARDFIKKPVEKDILLHRLEIHLNITSYQDYLLNSVESLANNLAICISDLIECRDKNTGGHVVRTKKYVDLIGKELISNGVFADELSSFSLEMIVRASPLHDIGKIGIPDKILLKPARLDDEEFAVMKKHTIIGDQILESMYRRTPTQAYLGYARMIAASHHERYDGKGYPSGLAGNDIPLCGRIMAVADVYDAIVDDRVYRKGMSHTEAFRIIMEGYGTQFDPYVVKAFENCRHEFL